MNLHTNLNSNLSIKAALYLARASLLDHLLELIEIDSAFLVRIMLSQSLIHLFLGDDAAKFRESLHQVINCDTARVVDIKNIKKTFDARFILELRRIDGGRQEFSVVDLVVALVVYLADQFLNLLLGMLFLMSFVQGINEFISVKSATVIRIDFLENRSRFLKLVL